jgi:catechol 2,3-dioxygenase-like lactoylglutathione lyase family enzyme
MIFQSLDHVMIAVADLDAATASYRTLLGRAPSWRGEHPTYGTRNTLFRLENTYIELLAAVGGAKTAPADAIRDALGERSERPFGLALAVADVRAAANFLRGRGLRIADPADGEGIDERSGRRRTWRSAFIDPTTAGGLRLLLIQHTSPPNLLPRALSVVDETSVCLGVDHVVLFTSELNATLRLWTGTFDIPEIWRRDFLDRGTRNVGLELGGITIECITRTNPVAGAVADRFWGLAYTVLNCEHAVARVRAAGIDIDNPRGGLAPGTQIATMRWHGTPTLLIQRDATVPSSE